MLASHTLPLAAAGAGIAAAVLLFTLVGRKRHLDGSGFLLVGIALGCLLSAATFLIALNAGAGMDMHGFTVNWMSGQLSRASWDYVWLLLPGWWLLSLAVVLSARWIDVLRFEDDVVTQLGGRANRWRRLGLCLSAALCAVCVGVGGGFGFIGFVTPHLVRVATRQASDSPWAVACLGAILLLTADAVGQYIMWPDQIPAGIVVAMLGTPCFILFMFRRKLVRNG
jgi:iron complex transport system permease protein